MYYHFLMSETWHIPNIKSESKLENNSWTHQLEIITFDSGLSDIIDGALHILLKKVFHSRDPQQFEISLHFHETSLLLGFPVAKVLLRSSKPFFKIFHLERTHNLHREYQSPETSSLNQISKILKISFKKPN